MSRRPGESHPASLVALVLLPVLVILCVVVLQAGALSTPNAVTVLGAQPPQGVTEQAWSEINARGRQQLSHVASDQNDAITYGWVGVILVATLGAGGAVVLLRTRTPVEIAPAVTPAPTGGRAEQDRSILIGACIDVSDTVPTESHREELLEALARVGVEPVTVASGERFDSRRHRAAGWVPTPQARLHHQVAETERVGFIDRGKPLRPPSVLVYDGTRERSL